MAGYSVPANLGARLASPFLVPPENGAETLRKVEGKRWREKLVLENYEFKTDPADPTHESVKVQFKVSMNSDFDENRGRIVTHFLDFYWKAAETGTPDNRAKQTQISYQNFVGLVTAMGYSGFPSPGEIDPSDVQGMNLSAVVTVAKDKTGTFRQRLDGWQAD